MMELVYEPQNLGIILSWLATLYLLLPVGSIPYITPSIPIINTLRVIDRLIAVCVAVFLYLNDFTLVESVVIGLLWGLFATYLRMVPVP